MDEVKKITENFNRRLKLTRAEEILVADLKCVKARTDLIAYVISALRTKEQQMKMDDFLVESFRMIGKVSEEEILKAVMILLNEGKHEMS